MNLKTQISVIILILSTLFVSCNKEPVPPPEPVIERITIAQLRQMHENGILSVDTNVYIQGIVTLTPELGNLPGFTAYVQDSTAGICLTIEGDNTLAMNSEIKLLCRGASFTVYNGLLQFGDFDIAKQIKLEKLTADPPFPVTVTLADLLEGKHQ